MEKKGRKEGLLERTAEVFDLPGDVVAGLPRVELLGDRQLRMENHRGILAYGSEEIHISGGKLIVKVRGAGLTLRAMNASELIITGERHAGYHQLSAGQRPFHRNRGLS